MTAMSPEKNAQSFIEKVSGTQNGTQTYKKVTPIDVTF